MAKTVELGRDHVAGNPLDGQVDHGPQIDEEQFNKVMTLIDSGIEQGVKLKLGGEIIGPTSFFVEPTVFSNGTDEMDIAKEEIFGPVEQIVKFKDKKEVIEHRANHGLGAGLFTEDQHST